MKSMTKKNYVVAQSDWTREYLVLDSATFFFKFYATHQPIIYTNDLKFAKKLKRNLNKYRA